LKDLGITVVLVEHDMRLVMSVCDRIVVLDHGEKIAEARRAGARKPAVIAPISARKQMLKIAGLKAHYGGITALAASTSKWRRRDRGAARLERCRQIDAARRHHVERAVQGGWIRFAE